MTMTVVQTRICLSDTAHNYRWVGPLASNSSRLLAASWELMLLWPLREGTMTDKAAIVARCQQGDQSAWNGFFKLYDRFILNKVKQSFAAMGNFANEEDLRLAYDYIIDQLLYNAGLQGYTEEHSFEGYLATMIRRRVIDWLRRRTAEHKLYGESDHNILVADQEEPAAEPAAASGLLPDLSPASRLVVKLYLLRYYDLEPADFALIEERFGRRESQVNAAIESLRQAMADRFAKGDNCFAELSLAHAKYLIMAKRLMHSDLAKADPVAADSYQRKQARYEKLLEAYQKRGFEEFPKQRELCEILGCHRRMFEKMVEKLKKELVQVNNLAA